MWSRRLELPTYRTKCRAVTTHYESCSFDYGFVRFARYAATADFTLHVIHLNCFTYNRFFIVVVLESDVGMLNNPLQKIRIIADYQFGRGVGKSLFPNDVKIAFSKRTGRIRHVYLEGKLLGTLRPNDGLFSLTVEGARRLMLVKPLRYWVKVQDDVSDVVAEGRSVFAKHVVDCHEDIKPEEEVVVVDGRGEVLAVGRAVLTGREMKAFMHGVAVRVRWGVLEKAEGKLRRGS